MNRVQLFIELKKRPQEQHQGYLESLGMAPDMARDWLMDYEAHRFKPKERAEEKPFTESPVYKGIAERMEWLKRTGEKLHGNDGCLERNPPGMATHRRGNIAPDLSDLRQRIDPHGYD